MNKQVKDLIINYINETIRYGISNNAYDILSSLIKEDRDMAISLCDIYETLVKRDGIYMLPLDTEDSYEL